MADWSCPLRPWLPPSLPAMAGVRPLCGVPLTPADEARGRGLHADGAPVAEEARLRRAEDQPPRAARAYPEADDAAASRRDPHAPVDAGAPEVERRPLRPDGQAERQRQRAAHDPARRRPNRDRAGPREPAVEVEAGGE